MAKSAQQLYEEYYQSLNYPQVLYFILYSKGLVDYRCASWYQAFWNAYTRATDKWFFKQSEFESLAKNIPNIERIADAMDDLDLFDSDYHKALRDAAELIIRTQTLRLWNRMADEEKLTEDQKKYSWKLKDKIYVRAARQIYSEYYQIIKDHPEEINVYPEVKIAKHLLDKAQSPSEYWKVPDFLIGAETWTMAFKTISAVLAAPIIVKIVGGGIIAGAVVGAIQSAVDTGLTEAIKYQYGDEEARSNTQMNEVLKNIAKSAFISAFTGGLSKVIPDSQVVLSKILNVECTMLDNLVNKAYDMIRTGQKPEAELTDIVVNMAKTGLAAM